MFYPDLMLRMNPFTFKRPTRTNLEAVHRSKIDRQCSRVGSRRGRLIPTNLFCFGPGTDLAQPWRRI
jgi:hypothetical protein